MMLDSRRCSNYDILEVTNLQGSLNENTRFRKPSRLPHYPFLFTTYLLGTN